MKENETPQHDSIVTEGGSEVERMSYHVKEQKRSKSSLIRLQKVPESSGKKNKEDEFVEFEENIDKKSSNNRVNSFLRKRDIPASSDQSL